MTLKEFEKVNVASRTRYTVFNARGEYVDSFEDYILDEKGNVIHDVEAQDLTYSKIRKFENATVKYVSFSKVFKALTITLYTKGGE